MKKLLMMLALALTATLSLSAQEEWDDEISISYGIGAFTDINSSYVSGIFSGKQTSYIGAFGLEYFHRPSAPLGIGLLGTFGTCKWRGNDDARSYYIGIMPAAKYNWMNREHYSLYSKVALGILIGKASDGNARTTKVTFGWQASAIGAEFGNDFRGFLELGCGEQGILVAGLRYKF